ncbi:MAG: hypothetical protein ACYCXY_10160, partial [Acidimicrobiales bacterium]
MQTGNKREPGSCSSRERHLPVIPTSTALYLFDIVGQAGAAVGVAALGADEVSLAAAYHAVRAATPSYRVRRVVTASHRAVYYRAKERTWSAWRLHPERAEGDEARDSFPSAIEEERAVGLGVNPSAVVAHSCGTRDEQAPSRVVNAFGDVYPWALCIGCPEVVEYAAKLAAEVTERFELDSVELEASGRYGYEHVSAHDKTHPERSSEAERSLLSLCFYSACRHMFEAVGIDASRLGAVVAPLLRAPAATAAQGGQARARPAELDIVERLDGEPTEAVLRERADAARAMRCEGALSRVASGRELFVWL